MWNEYLHAWNTFAVCPFANCVYLVTEAPVPVESISIDDVSATLGADSTVSVTLTPDGATSDISFSSSNTAVFTVTKISNTSVKVSPVAVGTGTLTAIAENGKKGTATVTVTSV